MSTLIGDIWHLLTKKCKYVRWIRAFDSDTAIFTRKREYKGFRAKWLRRFFLTILTEEQVERACLLLQKKSSGLLAETSFEREKDVVIRCQNASIYIHCKSHIVELSTID